MAKAGNDSYSTEIIRRKSIGPILDVWQYGKLPDNTEK